MNIKKLFATLAGVSLFAQTVVPFGALAATYSAELQDAYDWAYGKGVTTMSSIDNANMYGAITRAEMAKMLSVYATEVLGYEADASKACNFTDIDSVKGDLHDYIIKSCQLGLMGQGITAFRPYDTISRAEFGTALSRTLWGDKYEGGTPYYANHLNALKAAGIMNQISNAESMKEVRGYVMLMLMRSEGGNASEKADCDDPIVALACQTDSDACPAECKASEEKEDTVVRAGDLEVSAEAAEGRKAIIGGTSDLDTITFKTSEEVTISKITLERYGYSTIDDVISVQLEDEDGNIIADAKELNSKGQVNLSIKKDYKKVDGSYRATVVVNTRELGKAAGSYTTDEKVDAATDAKYASGKNGSTLGFKVVDVDSTAKNLNVDKYSPYTYDLVNYDGSKVEFSSRNPSTKDYSYEAGEMYEVAKFRVKAPSDAAVLVKGFTLSDHLTGGNIDAGKYASKVKVTVDGKEVDGLKWNINKDDELVLSFDNVELSAKQTSTFAVSMSFNDDFDQFGYSIQYEIASMDKFNAVDKKTESRVSPATGKGPAAITWTVYTVKGGKIKLSGSKLGTVSAAAGANNVLVAQGEITVSEALRGSASINVTSTGMAKIDEIRLVINGEEYDGTKGTSGYTFKGLEIEKSGKVEVRVDVKDNTDGTIEFDGSLSSELFNLKYDESSKPVTSDQIVGSINLSNIRIQAAKAELNKSNTKEAELIKGESNRKTIFDGTYTAKKGTVTLKNFTIKDTSPATASFNSGDKVTFYVTVDGEEYDAVYDYSTGKALGTIDDIEVADGKSINVKVEIEMTPKATATGAAETFNIKFEGEDVDNNPAGEADEDTVKVKVVEQGTLNIDSTAKNTVLLKSKKTLAEFTVKPSKSSDDEIVLKSIVFSGSVTSGDIKVVVDGETFEADAGLTYKPEITVPANGVVVKVTLKNELTGDKVLEVLSVNENTNAKATFRKYFVPALLTISQQKNGDTTKYTVDVENDDSDTVSELKFYVNSGSDCKLSTSGTTCTDVAHINDSLSENGNTLSAINDEKAKSITAISYKVGGQLYFIEKATYEDFFKAGSDDLMVYSNK